MVEPSSSMRHVYLPSRHVLGAALLDTGSGVSAWNASVVRGGGETRIKSAIALTISFAVAIMLASPVSAKTIGIEVQDTQGDLILAFDADTCETIATWPENTRPAEVGYLDILSFGLFLKRGTYTFSMEVAGDLPDEGAALPSGWTSVHWVMWIDPEPWNPEYNPILSLFTVSLAYDGTAYACCLIDYATGEVLTALSYVVDGATLEIEFSATSIGDLEGFWWMPGAGVCWGPIETGYWDMDTTDIGAVPGQVWWDIPWPPA